MKTQYISHIITSAIIYFRPRYLLLLTSIFLLANHGFCSSTLKPKAALDPTFAYLLVELGKGGINTDNAMIRFQSGAVTTYDPMVDAVYFQGYGAVSLSTLSSDHVPLAINVMPFPKKSITTGLVVNVRTSGRYELYIKSISNVPQLFDVYLMDAYKKDSLDLRNNPGYFFDIDKKDTCSFGSKRFSLVIRQNPAYACRLINITATKILDSAKTSKQVQVAWETENEQSYTKFSAERSIDGGKTFERLDTLASSGLGTYSLVDGNPVSGENDYRVKVTDLSDSTWYSKIVFVTFSDTRISPANNIRVFPNPSSNNITLSVATTDTTPASYNITISNSSGMLIKQVVSNNPNWQGNVSDLLPGTYLVSVVNNKTKEFVGYSKFLKM
ncbi:MAG: T9SS type A sorting domain-containing protein [Mucilaginibacter sp.]